MNPGVSYFDWRYVLTMLEALAWVALVGAVIYFASTRILRGNREKQLVLLIFAAWAIASITLAAVNIAYYFKYQRPTFIRAEETQLRQYGN